MKKEELKKMLESYWYDYQYMKEKEKEIISIKKLLSNNYENELAKMTINFEELQLSQMIEKKQNIECILQKLNQPYRTLMYFKYISFLTFDQIADKMNYSTKRIYQLHSEAINTIIDLLNEEHINEK